VPEHLALEQPAGHGPAIQGREHARVRPAVVVQATRDQLLAGARLAGDQHVRVGRRDVQDQAPQRDHGGRAADELRVDRLAAGQPGTQRHDLEPQAAPLERAADDVVQAVGAERLLEEVVGAQAHGLDGHRDVAVPRHQDHRQLRIDPAGMRQQLEAAHSRQLDVRQQDAGEAGNEVRQDVLRGLERAHGASGQLHRLRAAEAHGGVVLDVEDRRPLRRWFHGAGPV
jgi:hypothetical protein